MEDSNVEVESTEVVAEREPASLSIREKLKQELNKTSEDNVEAEPAEQTSEESDDESSVETPAVQTQQPMLVPPADMNAAEKDAFLNPTPSNAHILQSYLNRRAYETRSDYSRKMQEVEQLKKQASGLYETIKQYEDEYARDGIAISDVAKRAIAWDKAMLENPKQTALDWLDSYGLSLNDLVNHQPQQQQPAQYLTREEAERIAEERYKSLHADQERKALEYYNQQVVNSFMNSKPLFKDPETASQLEAEMAPIVQALNATGRYTSPEQVLETAYNYVVNGNQTFSSLVSKMAAGPAIQQQQASVQKAKQAAKSISGSAGSGTPRVVNKDLRDNLRRRLAGGD
jgi:hypothetical protein